MFTLSCKDMGVMDCDFEAKGETAEEVLSVSMAHAMSTHDAKIAEMKKTMSDDQMKAAMMAAMKSA